MTMIIFTCLTALFNMQMAAFQIIAIQMMSANMLDDFFNRALLAGIGLAIIVGPLGCLIIWRQMAFFGDTLAHAALPGIALAMLAGERQFAADHKVIEITGLCASCRDG